MRSEWKDIPDSDHGAYMTMQDFVECCQSGGFIDYDGYGYYATATKMLSKVVVPSDVSRKCVDMRFTHVVWFNR